ncbi:MAG: hypothetical protein RBS07_14545 [Lentimicrobium sp.]|jgi:hypothetical protein|nr:hypothetical protein [Lentimicrobium sp.]
MKTSLKSFGIVLLAMLGLVMFSFTLNANPERDGITKKEALKEIREIKKNARFHIGSIRQIENYARQSVANFENFVVYAQLASTVGHHTLMYVRLAEATSKVTSENQLLTELARIVENPDIGIDRFEDILDAALKAKTQAEKDKVLEQINSIKAEFQPQSSEKPVQRDKKSIN